MYSKKQSSIYESQFFICKSSYMVFLTTLHHDTHKPQWLLCSTQHIPDVQLSDWLFNVICKSKTSPYIKTVYDKIGELGKAKQSLTYNKYCRNSEKKETRVETKGDLLGLKDIRNLKIQRRNGKNILVKNTASMKAKE